MQTDPVNDKWCFQKTLVLSPWCGRIQARQVNVVRKKNFIVRKGKGIICSTRREGFCASRKRTAWFISGWFYTTLKLKAGSNQ
jgi:hypothetical protein